MCVCEVLLADPQQAFPCRRQWVKAQILSPQPNAISGTFETQFQQQVLQGFASTRTFLRQTTKSRVPSFWMQFLSRWGFLCVSVFRFLFSFPCVYFFHFGSSAVRTAALRPAAGGRCPGPGTHRRPTEAPNPPASQSASPQSTPLSRGLPVVPLPPSPPCPVVGA